jgi:hypothetical protein
MLPRELRGWLLCKPRPAALRVVAGDQQIHKLEITEGVRWVEVANTVCSLQPELVEALDAKGNLLRAVRPDEVEIDDRAPPNTSLEQDPENARLITFAKLLSDAYKDSREFTAMAFDKLGELFQAVVAKANSQEKTISALDRMVQKLMLEKVAESAAAEGDGDGPLTLDSLLQGMLQGKLQAEAERRAHQANGANGAPTNGTTNGAPKPKEGAKK